ncbi:MAG: hypothetical protein ACFFBD_25840 [Candidatus Hodarchaeota archaeon]
MDFNNLERSEVGLARIAAEHICLNSEQKSLILYFDQDNIITNKVLVSVLQKYDNSKNSIPNLEDRIKVFKIKCSQCGNNESVKVKLEQLDHSKGGMARAGIEHICLNSEKKLIMLYFDPNYVVRNEILIPFVQERINHLDKIILKTIRDKGSIVVEEILDLVKALESDLGIQIDRPIIEKLLDKYTQLGLITISDNKEAQV